MKRDIDGRILEALVENAKAAVSQIAKRTGIPPTTVHNHIKRMERDGVILSYRPVLDYAKLGRSIHALVMVTAEGKADQEQLARQMRMLPGVERAVIVTGGSDLFLEARLGTVDELNNLLIHHLRKIPGIDKTQTMIVLSER